MAEIDNIAMKNNIWKYYIYNFFYLFVIFEPVIVIYFQKELLLSLTQIMVAVAFFTLMVGLLEIPTGVIADKLGYKKTLLLGALTMLIGSVGYGLAQGFVHVIIADFFWALGFSFTSGTCEAFLYDTLKSIRRENEFNKINGRATALFWGGMVSATLIGGLLANINLSLPIQLAFIPFIIPLGTVLSFREPYRKRTELSHLSHAKEAMLYVFNHRKIKFLIFYMVLIYMIMEGAYRFYQPFMLDIGLDLLFFGVIFAAGYAFSGFGALISHKLDKYFGERKLLVLLLSTMVLSFAILSLISWKIAVLGVLLILIVDGVSGPALADYLNKNIQSHNRATVNSIGNLFKTILASLFLPFFGLIADKSGLPAVFTVFLGLTIFGLVIVLVWSRRF